MKIKITLDGCDDSTYIEHEVNGPEFDLLCKISEKSKQASSYQCMPIMEIQKIEEFKKED